MPTRATGASSHNNHMPIGICGVCGLNGSRPLDHMLPNVAFVVFVA